jgi:UDP-N-acetylglucosamine 2-epimerase
LDALLSFSNLECVLIGPNSDSGGDQFRCGLQQFTSKHGRSRYYASLEGDEFLFLMSRVDVLIGNSSSGMIETPFFLLPFINVGDRQRGRESADNVINVPYDTAKIRKAVSRALQTPRKTESRNPYDLFPYPEREFVNQLFRLVKDPDLRRKSFHPPNEQG